MKNSFVYTIFFTFVLCFLLVLILSFTNGAVLDKIEANARFTRDRAILLALGAEDADVDTIEEVDSQFKSVEHIERNDADYYVGSFNNTKAYATYYEGPGLWGTIYGYIAFSEDGAKVVGFQVTDNVETPGLGARVTEPWFLDQLKGEKIVNNTIKVGVGGTGDTDSDNGIIDGITGATRTSDGIQGILNKSIQQYNNDFGGN